MTLIQTSPTSFPSYVSSVPSTARSQQVVVSNTTVAQNTDAYIPGTGGQILPKFTIYHALPSLVTEGGGLLKAQQNFLAITLVATDARTPPQPTNNSRTTLAADGIDRNEPGAIFANGRWMSIDDFLKANQKSSPNNTLNAELNLEESPPQYYIELTPEESAALTTDFGEGKRIQIMGFHSDDPVADPLLSIKHLDDVPNGNKYSLPPGLQSQLADSPGLIWSFEGENKVFEEHDILNGIFYQTFTDAKTKESVFDEYGYTYHVPGYYSVDEQRLGYGPRMDENGQVLTAIISVDRLESPFGGLTLGERDLFWNEIQKIFDQNDLKVDARKEEFRYVPSGLIICGDEPGNGGWSWWGSIGLDQQMIDTLNKETATNSTIRGLFEKMEKVRKGEIVDDTLAQQYSIRVTDNEGNRLANDRIIVEAKNGNQVEMSVKEFKQLDRKQITALLQQNGATAQKIPDSQADNTFATRLSEKLVFPRVNETFQKADTTLSLTSKPASEVEAKTAKNLTTWGILSEHSTLGKILGIGLGAGLNPLKALAESINRETLEIERHLKGTLKKAGISFHAMDRLTINVDSEGKLILGGIKDKKTLAKIEKLLAQNENLGDRLSSLAAKKEVLKIFEKGDIAVYQFANSEKYDNLKSRLIQGYLKENKVDLEKVKSSEGILLDPDGKLMALLADMPDLKEEATRLLDEKRLVKELDKAKTSDATMRKNAKRTDTKAMFVFQNGLLLDQNVKSESQLTGGLQTLLGLYIPGHKDEQRFGHPITIGQAIALWNDENTDTPGNQIRDFKLRVDERGNYRVTELNSNLGGGESGRIVLESWLAASGFGGVLNEMVGDIFETHQAHHGDVGDYKHEAELQFSNGMFSYEMRSEEADTAALADIEEKTVKIGKGLTDFFQSKFASSLPNEKWNDHFGNGFTIQVGENGKLMMDIDLLQNKSPFVGYIKNTAQALNERLMSDDPFAETGFKTKLDPQLNGALKELVELQSDLKRIHDPAKRTSTIKIG